MKRSETNLVSTYQKQISIRSGGTRCDLPGLVRVIVERAVLGARKFGGR
jgi:hypothetical protein